MLLFLYISYCGSCVEVVQQSLEKFRNRASQINSISNNDIVWQAQWPLSQLRGLVARLKQSRRLRAYIIMTHKTRRNLNVAINEHKINIYYGNNRPGLMLNEGCPSEPTCTLRVVAKEFLFDRLSRS